MSSDVTGRPWELAIRHPSGRGGQERVVLELSSADGAREVVEVPFKPLLNDEIREMLHWYFDDFRAELPASQALAERIERTLLEAGNALGDRIEDDKRTLARFGARASAAGVHLLHVKVSSDDPDFLQEPWELLVLPESKYFVAAAGASLCSTPWGSRRSTPSFSTSVSRAARTGLSGSGWPWTRFAAA